MGSDEARFGCAEDLLRIEDVSRESLADLEAYVDLLLHWQKTINLISASTVPDIWHRHIADSLQLLPLVSHETRTLLDLGSGAGLPGMVLAIALKYRAPIEVHLVESNAKKAAFLREAARITKSPVKVHAARIESLDSAALQIVPDVITARALAPLRLLLEYCEQVVENRPVALLPKGREAAHELTTAAKYWNIAYDLYPSLTDREACILKVKEATRVQRHS